MWFRVLLFLLFATPSWAGLPPTRILDEGTDQGVAFKFDCVGAGISCTQSGITGTLTVGGGAGGWTDDGTELRLTTSTDEVEIGSAGTLSAKFAVNGDADEIQALIQGNATQTSDILVIENSAGTDILTGAAGGIKVTGNAQITQLASCDTIDTDANGIMRCGSDSGAASGAPTDADYLVGTTNGSLSAEIVVGTTPGGELGNTWASPTLDDSVTVTGWVMGASTATTPSADDNDTSLATTAYVQTEINAMGGRSLTAASGLMDADAELYTDTKCIWFEYPTAADDFKSIWTTNIAATITGITCESDQTVNFDLQVDDGTPTGVNGSDIACTTFARDGTLAGDTTVAVGDRLDIALTSVSGIPTWVSICFDFTYDD